MEANAAVNGITTHSLEATVTQVDPSVATTVLTDTGNTDSVTAIVDNAPTSVTATASDVNADATATEVVNNAADATAEVVSKLDSGATNTVTRVALGVTPSISTVVNSTSINASNLPKGITTIFYPWQNQPTVIADAKFDDGVAERLGIQIRTAVQDRTQNVKYVYDVVNIIGTHTYAERKRIAELYKTEFGANMSEEICKVLRKDARDLALSLLSEPGYNDARCIKEAISGPVSFFALGTDEDTLIEILTSRTNAEIVALKSAYKTMYGKDVEDEIRQDTSGLFEDFLVALLNANRVELGVESEPLTDVVIADVAELYAVTKGRYMGSDMFSTFNRILCLRSFQHINLVNTEYKNAHDIDLEQLIENEAAEHLRDGYMAIVKLAKSQAGYFAELLYKNITSMNSSDSVKKQFMRILSSRSEKDLGAVITFLGANFSTSLASVIAKESSASYRQLLYALTGVTSPFAQ